MKRILTISILGALFLTMATLKPFQCRNGVALGSVIYPEVNPAFAEYISAFSAGSLSTTGRIKVQLSAETGIPIELNTPIENTLFEVTPQVSGHMEWSDTRLVEFVPDEPLLPNKVYTVKFALHKLLPVKDELSEFTFQVKTIQQHMSVALWNIEPYAISTPAFVKAIFNIETADAAVAQQLETCFSISGLSDSPKFKWEHDQKARRHTLIVDSLPRGEATKELRLTWTGKPILAITDKESIAFKVKPTDDFSIIRTHVEVAEQATVSIFFSDLLSNDLNGLVQVEGTENFTYFVDKNQLKLFFNTPPEGSHRIVLHSGISNIRGKKLGKNYSFTAEFTDNIPAVSINGTGNILPDEKGLILPFSTKNLLAVDVSIIKIFENNVSQFLQTNTLDGEDEMARVAKLIKQKTLRLDDKAGNNAGWTQHALDLNEMIKTEPGAIYRVVIGFKQSYTDCNCQGKESKLPEMEHLIANEVVSAEPSEYGYYSNYQTWQQPDYDEDYNWNERSNPCKKAFYFQNREVSRNILASNMGLLAKRSNSNNLLVTITDLKTAKPIQGALIEVLDFQRQPCGMASSNADGMAQVNVNAKPFLVIAKNGKERAYLKVDEYSSIQLGMFDVAGELVQSGLKGFIYGERGVWRPGDTIFLNFMLENRNHALPATLPVSLELSTPLGQLYKRVVNTKPLNGFYSFPMATEPNVPTGNWTATVKVGSATFSKTLKVETIMPNRLKIDLNTGYDQIIPANANLKLNLQSNWLHGAPANSLKTDVVLNISKIQTEFKGYKEYLFDNAAANFMYEEQTLFDGKLSVEGKAAISFDLNSIEKPTNKCRLHFKTRVFEEGGNFSIDKFSMDYSPFTHYVGLKNPSKSDNPSPLFTGKVQKIKTISLTQEGKPAAGRTLKLRLKKLSWRWWWDREEEDSDYNYYEYATTTQELSGSSNGDGSCEFDITVPNDEWGRYVIEISDEASEHTVTTEVWFDWENWWTRSNSSGGKSPATLQLSSDKTIYATGELIKIAVPGTANSRAMVSIEKGNSVLKAYWVNIDAGQNEITIKADEQMTPNIYVHITLLQPFGQTVNDLPIRQYGVVNIKVEDPKSHLQPLIASKDVFLPENTAQVSVSEKGGKAMTYTLAIVDDGLLDLTRFKTPDPWPVFYAREALGVKTWDLFDYVIGAWAGTIESVLAIGGDEGLLGKDGAKANRFKPMVRVIGPFELKKGSTNNHKIHIPAYVGSARIMVVAGQESAYGFAEKTVQIRKPLMLLATLPRVMGINESCDLTVTTFAMEKGIGNVSLSVKGDKRASFSISKQQLSFTQTGEKVSTFKLQTGKISGISKIEVTATDGKHSAKETIEIAIRNPLQPITRTTDWVAEAGKTVQIPYETFGDPEAARVTVELTCIKNLNIESRLRYLIQYPHGCAEQTTSGVFPQLYLSKLLDITPQQSSKIESNVKAGIQKLKLFQTPDGGMAYWPGGTEAEHWITNYAGHFMLEAEKAGYSLPHGWKQKWVAFQKKNASNWQMPSQGSVYGGDESLIQAYRLFTLALAGQPDLSAMNRLKATSRISISAKWRLAAAYGLAGQKQVAIQLINTLPTEQKPYREMDFTFGSNERDEAMILETLTLLELRSKASALLKRCVDYLASDAYYSTQSTAYNLMAVSKFIQSDKRQGLSASIIHNRTTKEVNTPLYVFNYEIPKSSKQRGVISITNKGKSPLFISTLISGLPEPSESGPEEKNLSIKIRYTDLKHRPLDVSNLKQGTDFIAEVSVTNPSPVLELRQLALSQVFAPGWEIRNLRMEEEEGEERTVPVNGTFNYQDIRDDRVNTYFHLAKSQTKTFKVYLNAAYAGTYFLPGANASAMYDNQYYARTGSSFVNVFKEKPVL